MHRKTLFGPLALCLTLLLCGGVRAQSVRPNIIFILTDDLGYEDVGKFFQDSREGERKFDTPRLDQLAEEGMMLTDHYVGGPVCAPSRASFLLGLHQGHSQIRDNQFDKELPEGLNVASLLSGAGYRTIHVGKYGLAGKRGSDLAAHPLRRGFTDFFGYLHHIEGHEHYPRNGTTDKQAFVTDGYKTITTGTDKTYTTDLFTARAKAYLTEQHATRPEQPVFMYLAYDTPHKKLQLPTGPYPEGYGRSGGLRYTGTDNTETPYVNTARGEIDSYVHVDYRDKPWPETEKVFATMIRRIDTAVGDLMQLLVDLDMDENTVVIFSSDNGPHNTDGQLPTFFRSFGPFSGIKRDMYEGGIRVPTLVRWPGHIAPASATSEPAGNWDWLATFAELAGLPVPAYTDGTSLLPVLDRRVTSLDREYLYWEYFHGGSTPEYAEFPPTARDRRRGQMQAVRIGDIKGVRFDIQGPDDTFELYDLTADSTEATDLAASMPDLERRMQAISRRARIPDASAERPYDEAPVPALSKPPGLSNGIVRRSFDTTGTWLPARPEFIGEAVPDSRGPSGDVAEGLPGGQAYAWSGYLNAPRAGHYTFQLENNGSVYVRLHDIHLLRNEHSTSTDTVTASLDLEAGFHPFTILYRLPEGERAELYLRWQVPGTQLTALKLSDLSYDRESITKQ